MNTQVTGLRVAGIIFAIMCVAQIARLIIQPEVLVEGHRFPLWPSMIAVLLLGALSVWLLSLATNPCSRTTPGT